MALVTESDLVTSVALEVSAQSKLAFVDLTDDLRSAVERSGLARGIVVAYCMHTTCALLINENEEGALEDARHRLELLVPATAYYAHDDMSRRTQNLQGDAEPPNGQAHVMQMLLGATSQVIPVSNGKLVLGTWQRLLLIELDEPRPRQVHLCFIGSAAHRLEPPSAHQLSHRP